MIASSYRWAVEDSLYTQKADTDRYSIQRQINEWTDGQDFRWGWEQRTQSVKWTKTRLSECEAEKNGGKSRLKGQFEKYQKQNKQKKQNKHSWTKFNSI